MAMGHTKVTPSYLKNFRSSTIVRNEPPGVGKTTTTTVEITNNPSLRVVVLSETHLTLDEVESKLPSTETIHWRGHDQLCPVAELHGLPPDVACQLCRHFKLYDDKECPYKNQFSTKRRIVLMPYEFLSTKYADELSPDLVWMEESCTKLRVWHEPAQSVVKLQSEISGMPIHEIILDPDLAETRIIDHLKTLEPEEAIKTAKIVFNPRPKEVAEYYDRQQSGKPVKVPYIVLAYRYAQRKSAKILITDATFSEDVWRGVLSVHNYLENGHPLPQPEFEHIKAERYEYSIIYRMGRGWYPRQTLSNPRVLKNIAGTIERIAFYFRLRTIPIITFKTTADVLASLLYNYNVETLHFGNLRTRNDFAEYPVGFVVGTYNIGGEEMNRLLDNYAPWMLSKKQTKIQRYHYQDGDAEALRKWVEDSEQYQAIHRFRPLRKPTRIFVWGLVPDTIKNEMSVVELRDIGGLIHKWARVHHKPGVEKGLRMSEEFIHDYNSEYVPIAELKEYLVRKGLSYNTAIKVVSQLKKEYPLYTVSNGRGKPRQYLVVSRYDY